MRLTLRTMLAFLDDVLEGPDAKELEQKIDESKFASDLVHRIRGSVRRLRLGAPKLDGKGMGADANTVAEYLDNTMPPEHVPEFETVCLESDVQLAEVAACHQVLTIVLGEPAAVDPAIRDRMYRIGHGGAKVSQHAPDGQDGNGTSAPARSASPGEIPVPPRPAPVAPEAAASRKSRGRPAKARPVAVRAPGEYAFPLKSLAVTLLLFFVVTAVALRAIAPINANHPLWVLFAGKVESPQLAQPAVGLTADSTTKAAASNSDPNTTDTPKPETESSPDATGTSSSQASSASSETVQSVDSGKGSPDAEAAVTPPVSSGPSSSGPSSSRPSSSRPSSAPAVAATPEPMPQPVDATALPAATSGAASTSPAAAPSTAVVPKSVGETTKPPENVAPVNVGRYMSEEQVLARLDVDKEAWMVLPPDTPLNAGERLLSLPTYRPQIFVAPTVKLTVAGEAFLKLHAADAANTPRVTFDFGRAILVPVGEMAEGVHVDFAGRSGQLVFQDVDSVVAIEVRPVLPLGSDPRTTTPNLLVQLWATTGGAEWREAERPPVRVQAGQRLQLIDEAPGVAAQAEEIPGWIDGKNLSDIDRRASQELRKFLTADRPLALSLLEQTNHRHVEVRALSCRSLCYFDIFEPAIAALGDSLHRSYWSSQIDAIQTTLPFGPDSVAKLMADINKLHGKDADRIFRLLQGYSPEQLSGGGAAELVESLENESMTIRVLAFFALHRITDMTQMFRPDDRPEHERSKVAKWRKLLDEGQIKYKRPPAALPTAAPAAGTDATPK